MPILGKNCYLGARRACRAGSGQQGLLDDRKGLRARFFCTGWRRPICAGMDRRRRNPASGASIATCRVTTACRSPTQTGCSCQRASKLSLDPSGSIVGYVYKRRLKRRAEIACGWDTDRCSHLTQCRSCPRRRIYVQALRVERIGSTRFGHRGRSGVTGPWSPPPRDRSALRLVSKRPACCHRTRSDVFRRMAVRVVHSADRSASAFFSGTPSAACYSGAAKRPGTGLVAINSAAHVVKRPTFGIAVLRATTPRGRSLFRPERR
jgi:hypothetical protein